MTDDVIDDETQEIDAAPEQFPDGIYLTMDEDVYHAQHRLSASGIKTMLASEADFWAGSWMNPDRENTTTDAQILGRAFHTARLEPEKLESRFVRAIEKADYSDDLLTTDSEVRAEIKARQPQKADYPGAIATDADVKRELKERGEKQSLSGEAAGGRRKRLAGLSSDIVFWDDIVAAWEDKNGPIAEPEGETHEDRARRLLSYGYTGTIWCLEKERFEAELAGREALPAIFWDQVQADIKSMRGNDIAADNLTGGLAEVSVLWTDEATGVKMKSRIDYLKPDKFTDVKTFDNPQKKPLRQCIYDQFRFNGYYLQARVYSEATEQIRIGDLPIWDAMKSDVIDQIRERKAPLNCVYVFQQKRGVPNVIACPIHLTRPPAGQRAAESGADEESVSFNRDRYANRSLFAARAEHEIAGALDKFKRCMEVYGEGKKWRPLDPEIAIDDEGFNGFWLEGEWV